MGHVQGTTLKLSQLNRLKMAKQPLLLLLALATATGPSRPRCYACILFRTVHCW